MRQSSVAEAVVGSSDIIVRELEDLAERRGEIVQGGSDVRGGNTFLVDDVGRGVGVFANDAFEDFPIRRTRSRAELLDTFMFVLSALKLERGEEGSTGFEVDLFVFVQARALPVLISFVAAVEGFLGGGIERALASHRETERNRAVDSATNDAIEAFNTAVDTRDSVQGADFLEVTKEATDISIDRGAKGGPVRLAPISAGLRGRGRRNGALIEGGV